MKFPASVLASLFLFVAETIAALYLSSTYRSDGDRMWQALTLLFSLMPCALVQFTLLFVHRDLSRDRPLVLLMHLLQLGPLYRCVQNPEPTLRPQPLAVPLLLPQLRERPSCKGQVARTRADPPCFPKPHHSSLQHVAGSQSGTKTEMPWILGAIIWNCQCLLQLDQKEQQSLPFSVS